MTTRAEVEALLRLAKVASPSPPMRCKISPVNLAALCEAWLAAEAAPVARFPIYKHGPFDVQAATACFDSPVSSESLSGQHVRIVPIAALGEGS